MSKTTTIAKMRRNGRLVRVKPDGTEEALDTPPLPPLSAAEIEAAAARDHETRRSPMRGQGNCVPLRASRPSAAPSR